MITDSKSCDSIAKGDFPLARFAGGGWFGMNLGIIGGTFFVFALLLSLPMADAPKLAAFSLGEGLVLLGIAVFLWLKRDRIGVITTISTDLALLGAGGLILAVLLAREAPQNSVFWYLMGAISACSVIEIVIATVMWGVHSRYTAK